MGTRILRRKLKKGAEPQKLLLLRYCMSKLSVPVKGIKSLTTRATFELLPVENPEFELLTSSC